MAGLKSMVIVLVVMMVASFLPQFAIAQTRHVVGDTLGWTVPTGNANYTTWASGQTFRVGDSLIFNFPTGAHDVAEVSEAAYGPCTTANPMSLNTTGPVTLRLTTSGNHYYICTVGSHCQLGQKFTINVAASNSTPPSATSPAPSGTMPSSPDGMPSPPPPSPSSASAFTVVVPVTFLAAVIALFY